MYPNWVTIVGPLQVAVCGERDTGRVGGGLTRKGIRGVGQSMVFKRYILMCSNRM